MLCALGAISSIHSQKLNHGGLSRVSILGSLVRLTHRARIHADSPVDLSKHISRGETTMRFMVIVPASKESEAGILPDGEILTAMGKFNEEMVKAGVMLAGEGLHATSKGARIKFSGGKTTVTDGPFTESKELIAGFWLIQVKSKEEAIAWMKRAPFGDGVMLELRQVFETEDFGANLTPELRRQEERLRAQTAAKAKS